MKFMKRFAPFLLALLIPVAAHAVIGYSSAVRIARLDAVESTTGASAILRIRSGSMPSTCATADSGTVLAEMTLPSDWMAGASGTTVVTKAKSGTWQDTSANATGTAGHFRIYDPTGSTCHIQGTVSGTGGGGDMELDNTSINATQSVTVNTFQITSGNP